MPSEGDSELRVAVIGHAEHVTIAPVARLPAPGEIVHLDGPIVIAGGGGGIAFHQLVRNSGDVHLFTALGNDDAAAAVEASLAATGARIHAASRDTPHTRDLALITPGGERTILVVGEPLHPRRSDDLPWDVLAGCDAVYFTAQDSGLIRAARAATLLIVSARRAEALADSGVRADVVVGSARDPREASVREDYAVPPDALVMTEGALGGRIETATGIERFDAPAAPVPIIGSYGAGDSFAGAMTWYLACGMPIGEACTRAAVHGAAVLRGINPLEWQLSLEVAT